MPNRTLPALVAGAFAAAVGSLAATSASQADMAKKQKETAAARPSRSGG